MDARYSYRVDQESRRTLATIARAMLQDNIVDAAMAGLGDQMVKSKTPKTISEEFIKASISQKLEILLGEMKRIKLVMTELERDIAIFAKAEKSKAHKENQEKSKKKPHKEKKARKGKKTKVATDN